MSPDETWTLVDDTQELSATVLDQYGNVVAGGNFQWSTDQSGVVAVDTKGVAYGLKVGKGEVFAEDTDSKLRGSAWVHVEARVPSAAQKSSGDGQKGVVGKGLTHPVVVRVLDKSGAPLAGVPVAWRVVGDGGDSAGSPTSPASVTNADGVAETTWTLGTTSGKQYLEANVDGVLPQTFTADAAPGPVASLDLSPGTADLVPGQTEPFTALAKDEFGNPVPGATLAWSSSDAGVATVCSVGVASALAVGSAEIRATSGSVVGTAQVTVREDDSPPSVASVAVSPSAVSLEALGESAQLTAVAADPSGNPVTDATIEWSSLDPSIATVDEMGTVLAKAIGSALIVASAACSQAADTVEVKVTQVPAEVVVSPASRSLAVGQTHQFAAVVKDAMGYVIPGLDIVWSSDDASIATVDGSGTVTGRNGGSTQIRGVHQDLQSQGTVQVTQVSEPPPGTPVSAFFFDGFESGSRAAPANGFSWTNTSNPSVSNEHAYSGNYSLRFFFRGKPDGEDSTSEQRFTLPPLREMWFEYFIYFPNGTEQGFESAAYAHRTQSGVLYQTVASVDISVDPYRLVSENPVFAGAQIPIDAGKWRLFSIAGAGASGADAGPIVIDAYIDDYTVRLREPLGTTVTGAAATLDLVPGASVSNNKFWRITELWTGSCVNMSLEAYPSSTVGWITRPRPMWGNPCDGIGSSEYRMKHSDGLVKDEDLGRWNHWRFHIKVSDPGQNNGVFKMWKDGTLVINETALPNDPQDHTRSKYLTGYLMGWANSGFSEDTLIFIDDIQFYDLNPGW